MKNKDKKIIILAICLIVLFGVFLVKNCIKKEQIVSESEIEVRQYYSNNNEDEVFLSDIDYLPGRNQSYPGWDEIRYDQTNSGKITVKIEGGAFEFKKGIWAHATSQITYDISQYNYKYFTSYIGLNTTSTSGNGVIYKIYTSADGVNWGEPSIYTKKPGQEATFIKIDLEGANYLRLYADANGQNGSDHSVYADAKLTNSEKPTLAFGTKEEYDELIKQKYTNQENITGELEFDLLKRQLINNVGSFTLSSLYNASEDNKEAIDFLMTNQKALKYYILGGEPSGNSYYKSLTEFSRLYKTYKEDFKMTETTKYGTVIGDLYTRMAIAMSLTHSQNFGLWLQPDGENSSDAVRRYQIYKDMHKNGNFVVLKNEDGTPQLNEDGTPKLDVTQWFENYSVEEMRYIFNNLSDDEETLWLNEYTQSFVDQDPKQYGKYLSPHPYMDYRWENFNQPEFYDPDRKDEWDAHFKGLFSKYNVTYRSGLKKIWMLLRNPIVQTGAVCGGISKVGSSVRTSHGIPCVVIGQPGHAAMIYYWQDANGKGYWNLDNDVSGWTLSEKGERLLLGWGNANSNYAKGSYQVVYMLLAQEALNDYENLEKAEELVMLADVYKGDLTKQEEIYKKALEIQNINVDAWLGLINLYNQSETKTQDEYFDLAEKLAEDLKYFPLPMQQLTNLIKPKLTTMGNEEQNVQNLYKFTLLQTRILTEGTKTPNNTKDDYYVYQPSLTRLEANYLLGKLDKTIATFSFDGEDAGKIVLASRFDNVGVRWDYSLDGKQTWHEVSFSADEEHKLQLTENEIKTMTSENDLYVHIVGVNYDEENLYKIDIQESAGLPATLYANDWENKFIASNPIMEWKYRENDNWTSYRDNEPDLTGNKTVTVRMGGTGVCLPSASTTYTFTADNQPDTRKYIPISHLSIQAYSTQSQDGSRPFYAPNAIDGNLNTLWHTDFQQNVLQQSTKPFLSIKIDEPKNISALEFIQKKYPGRPQDPDDIKNARVYVSINGETWTLAGQIENCETYGELYKVNFEKPVYGQYVKIEMDTKNMFSSLSMVNLYEDTTIVTLATFSFDTGKLMLTKEFEGTNWQYSLNSGTTWKNGNGDEHQLTTDELTEINAEDKIKIRLITGNKQSTIDIQNQDAPVITAYLNDLENRLIGIENTSNLEYRLEANTGNTSQNAKTKTWISYDELEPVVPGDTKLLIRKKANSILMASEPIEFIFTEDNQPATAKYVPIKHLSVTSFSSEDTGRKELAINAIDANINTLWHSNHSVPDTNRHITIKLDEPRYISKLQYVKRSQYLYGVLKDGIISVSMDGENWETVATIENLYNPTNAAELRESEDTKDIAFDKLVKAQYIKLQCTKSCDYVNGSKNGVPYDYFLAATMLNLFEDTTKIEAPTAEIEYSIIDKETNQKVVGKNPTNQNVTATLINKSENITITNNDGKDTYTFTENGEFTFRFINSRGIEGTATAKVDWIIKTLPTAKITYSTTNLTNQDVIATITFDREVRILDDEDTVITTIPKGEEYTYTFTENGSHEVRFKGPYGNEGTATATVNWIDKTAPTPTITYSSTNKENKPVTATITFNKENVTVEGGNTHRFTENGEYTFKFRDAAGNTGEALAKVTWIDKTLPKATITYSKETLTNQDVIATITFDREVRILNDNDEIITTIPEGSAYTYTFTENGSHSIRFKGPAGNEGEALAKVDWIDKTAPVGKITYSTTDLTNKDVTATITFNEEVTITNNGGKNTYTFQMNGEFEFQFVDKAGNTGTATAEVEWIDKREITATITYDINELTNKDVTATITFDKENVVVEGGNTHTFTENGIHEFVYVGPAGNTGKAIAEVTWIDKIPPAATVTYSTTEQTEGPVIATVTFDEGGVTIVDKDGNEIQNGNTHTFTKNGTHTFYYKGPLGNLGTADAKVTWIKEKEPSTEIFSTKYKIEENIIYNILPETTFSEFKKNVTTNKTLIIINKENKILQDTDVITTGMTVKVGNDKEFTAIVLGDTDSDGEITINDLAQLKLHILEITPLTDIYCKAADMDGDREITLNDLAQMKLVMLEKMTIEEVIDGQENNTVIEAVTTNQQNRATKRD